MDKLKFRNLFPDEVECRISTISDKGVSLLLYKDARVDQNLLDETVGIMNWKREHQMIGDNLYCTVSLWDDEKKQWISKQDVGKESNSEKEKGQASDSFKRACFNLGIGRELYTAPFIWIDKSKCNIKINNNKNSCYDKFCVKKMEVVNGNITFLEIWNTSLNRMVFSFEKGGNNRSETTTHINNTKTAENAAEGKIEAQRVKESKDKMQENKNEHISEIDASAIRNVIRRKRLSEESILSYYHLGKIEDMTFQHWTHAMSILEKYPDKEGDK